MVRTRIAESREWGGVMRGLGKCLAPSSDGYYTAYTLYCSAVYRNAVLYGLRGSTRKVLWCDSESMNS